MQTINEQIMNDMTPTEQLRELYNCNMPINDKELRHLMDEECCSACATICRVRQYIVQSICCNNRVCNTCHIKHLDGTTRPYCMHCKSVWTHYNITNWFTPSDAKIILNRRVSKYLNIADTYIDIKEKIVDLIKDQIVPHYPLFTGIRPQFFDKTVLHNPFIDLLRGADTNATIFNSRKKYTDISLIKVMDITEDNILTLIDSYGLVPQHSNNKKHEELLKQLASAGRYIIEAVRMMQELITENILTRCPRCYNDILDFDTADLHSIDCPHCNTVLSTSDYSIISIGYSAPICKITSRPLANNVMEMFSLNCTARRIKNFIQLNSTNI